LLMPRAKSEINEFSLPYFIKLKAITRKER
jgi:hypothetical protein